MTESVAPATVLIVDDDAALRTLYLALLTRQGFAVECVDNGAEAMERLSRNEYAVMVLDLMMPRCNGFEVLRDLAVEHETVLPRTIVATGVSERELKKLDASSVYAVLRKPFDIDRLIDTIRNCANQRTHPANDSEEDEDDAAIDGPARRFERLLPIVHKLLRSTVASEGEVVLRHELRRAVGRTAAMLASAATAEPHGARAARLTRLAESATAIVRKPHHDRRQH